MLEGQFFECENLAGQKIVSEKKRSIKFTIKIYSSILDRNSYLRFKIKIMSVL
jgi:hypothetical protein